MNELHAKGKRETAPGTGGAPAAPSLLARRGLGVTLGVTLGMTVSGAAQAHDVLNFPPPWVVEGPLGDPQKIAPCGVDMDAGGSAGVTFSNVVTTFTPGETITIRWQETIAHDGWFRIALSYKNRSDLVDPPYAADVFGNSTDAGIEVPPVAPVLVDGLYPHLASSVTTPQTYTYDLKLPDTPCEKCTLQLVQFMNHHPYNMPGGYFYHHCADISIQVGADGGDPTGGWDGGIETGGSDAGAAASSGTGGTGTGGGGGAVTSDGGVDDADGGTSGGASTSSGGCAASGDRGTTAAGLGGLAGLVAFAALFGRRRRRG